MKIYLSVGMDMSTNQGCSEHISPRDLAKMFPQYCLLHCTYKHHAEEKLHDLSLKQGSPPAQEAYRSRRILSMACRVGRGGFPVLVLSGGGGVLLSWSRLGYPSPQSRKEPATRYGGTPSPRKGPGTRYW